MMKFPIYLDNHSTTRPDDRVIEAMLSCLKDTYGNPSSLEHPFGWAASSTVDNSREIIADFIGAGPEEIIFTSGTTESNNLALKGLLQAQSNKRNHIITSQTEHPSVLSPLSYMEKSGFDVTYLPVDEYGLIDLNRLEETILENTLLVSVMAANNEIGTLAPIKEIAELCQRKGVLFHTDAAQAIGKVDFNVREIPVDLVSFSAHKNYGPKGIGALFVRKKSPRIKLSPLLNGGSQEKNLRSGTLDCPSICGFAEALKISKEVMTEETKRIKILRDRLQSRIFEGIEDLKLNGHPEKRLVNNLNISIKSININVLFSELRDLALSTGSACSGGSPEGSHVLKAIGLKESLVKSSIRFGLGRFTTEEEVDFTASRLIEAVNKVRKKNI